MTSVLLLSERADFYGGGQRSLRDLAIHLRGTPYHPIAVLPGSGPLATSLLSEGVEVQQLPLPQVRGRSGPRVLQSVWALTALAKRRQAFALHSDSPRSALYAGLAARLGRLSHVWHVRASIASSALSDRLLLGVTDRVVAVSRAAAERSAALRAADSVRVVPTGIRPPAFLDRRAARNVLGLPPEGFVAGVVGRVEPDKGCDDALSALAVLRAAVPSAILAFLGPADVRSPYDLALGRRAAASGLLDAVRFLGERDEAAPLLPAFDLLLHPSRHEALPRVLIEALFAGVPVVAASVGGVPEVVDHGHTGLLSPPRDPGALGAAAASLAVDPGRRLAMGRTAARLAERRFSLEAMLRGVTAVYEELRDRPGAASREGAAP
jgi:glycosyltransferase involved in cell wall biosynthesis